VPIEGAYRNSRHWGERALPQQRSDGAYFVRRDMGGESAAARTGQLIRTADRRAASQMNGKGITQKKTAHVRAGDLCNAPSCRVGWGNRCLQNGTERKGGAGKAGLRPSPTVIWQQEGSSEERGKSNSTVRKQTNHKPCFQERKTTAAKRGGTKKTQHPPRGQVNWVKKLRWGMSIRKTRLGGNRKSPPKT